MPGSEREPGFYWINFAGLYWEPAQWGNDGVWRVIDSNCQFDDHELAGIGERIVRDAK